MQETPRYIRLGFATYNGYLHSLHWLEFKRRAIRERGKNGCELCCKKDCPLEVHHLTYDTLGKETLNDVRVLCRSCHHRNHYPLFHISPQLTEKELRRRYRYLNFTKCVRFFRLGTFINTIGNAVLFQEWT